MGPRDWAAHVGVARGREDLDREYRPVQPVQVHEEGVQPGEEEGRVRPRGGAVVKDAEGAELFFLFQWVYVGGGRRLVSAEYVTTDVVKRESRMVNWEGVQQCLGALRGRLFPPGGCFRGGGGSGNDFFQNNRRCC